MVQCAHLHLALPSVPRPLVTRPCPGPSGVVNEHAPSGQSPNGQAGPALSADLNTPQVSSWPAVWSPVREVWRFTITEKSF